MTEGEGTRSYAKALFRFRCGLDVSPRIGPFSSSCGEPEKRVPVVRRHPVRHRTLFRICTHPIISAIELLDLVRISDRVPKSAKPYWGSMVLILFDASTIPSRKLFEALLVMVRCFLTVLVVPPPRTRAEAARSDACGDTSDGYRRPPYCGI